MPFADQVVTNTNGIAGLANTLAQRLRAEPTRTQTI
jgi:hypothetical protein